MNMQLTKLIQKHTMLVVLLIAMIAVFVNKSDPDLEQRVSDLENRVAVIEENLSGTDTVETSDNEKPHRENWRQLREGMSQDKVQELLGQPQRIDGGSLTVWHYGIGGRVFFSRGKVDRWSEPY